MYVHNVRLALHLQRRAVPREEGDFLMAQRHSLPDSDLAAWGRDEAKSQCNSPVAQLGQYRGAEATAVRGPLSRAEQSGRLLAVPLASEKAPLTHCTGSWGALTAVWFTLCVSHLRACLPQRGSHSPKTSAVPAVSVTYTGLSLSASTRSSCSCK